MSDEIDWEAYESPPYCRHWSVLWDCEEKCARCGHRCDDHGRPSCGPYDGIDQEPCREKGCACAGWVEIEAIPTEKTT